MANSADDHNPLLPTPVATIAAHIAAGLAAGAIADTRQFASNLGKEMASRAELSVTMAELVAQHLTERGHLPLTTETEEPKADDATLILQALMLGVATWVSFGPGDPRGVLHIGKLADTHAIYETRLVYGMPKIDDRHREELVRLVSPRLRAL